jgi:hypothetical protein
VSPLGRTSRRIHSMSATKLNANPKCRASICAVVTLSGYSKVYDGRRCATKLRKKVDVERKKVVDEWRGMEVAEEGEE